MSATREYFYKLPDQQIANVPYRVCGPNNGLLPTGVVASLEVRSLYQGWSLWQPILALRKLKAAK